MKRYLVLCTAFLTLLTATSMAQPTIGSITISGNRARESLIRANLGFKEGDKWNPSLIERAKRNLFRLKIFKVLDITTEPTVSSDTIKVNITAVDGWFLLPIPMATVQAGEERLGLLLTEQNFFRDAEHLSLFSSFGESGTNSVCSFSTKDFFLTFGERDTSITEYAYSDGGFSDKIFSKNLSKEQPGDLGTVVADYTRDIAEPQIIVGMSIADGIKASAGIKSTHVSYEQGSLGVVPSDSGLMNAVTFNINSVELDTIKDSDGLGRMFGLGMAEVKHVIDTGKRDPSLWLWNIGIENSGRMVSSDFPYTKTNISLARKTVFSWRNALTVSTRFISGTSLPLSEMPATNQQDGLRGYYAREFRGDSVVNSYISYTHPLHMTMTGYFNIETFYDWGVSFTDVTRHDRTGAGMNVSYRFWRFPLPLGLGVAYSFEDKNWQPAFTVGGRF
ncbi:MAG: POTRA domain-containing protein [Endomicrobiales bacterium]|jgi:hypothetical protein